MRILLIDDTEFWHRLIAKTLPDHQVEWVTRISDATGGYDAILCDWFLEFDTKEDVAEFVSNCDVPVAVVTASRDEMGVVDLPCPVLSKMNKRDIPEWIESINDENRT